MKFLLAVLICAILKLPVIGQEAVDFRGVWQVQAPEEGRLIIILKRNSLASYFWADNADRTVYQGSWSSDIEGALVLWDDESSHRITQNLLGYEITYTDAIQGEGYQTTMVKLPDEVLGQWAKEPPRPEDENLGRDRAKGFFGTWKIWDGTEPYYLIIEPDRSAATNWTQASLGNPSGLRGAWEKQGSELHISWDNGHYGILKENDRDFIFQLIDSGTVIEKNESVGQLATRIGEDQLPVEWQAGYKDERQAVVSNTAFLNRKNAAQFYRGSWIVQLAEDAFERIEIGRFGGLKTSKDSTLYGNWRMSGQDIFMNWDDGLRKVLSPVGNGFLLYEYKAGRPIDGVPTKIFSATPEDVGKLMEYMKGQATIAISLLRLAEEAGVTSSSANSTGLGQSFMRWAWPFGDQVKSTSLSETPLLIDFTSPKALDPWWWPLWSEDRATEINNSDVERDKVEISVGSKSVEANVDKTENKKVKNKFEKTDWVWPF